MSRTLKDMSGVGARRRRAILRRQRARRIADRKRAPLTFVRPCRGRHCGRYRHRIELKDILTNPSYRGKVAVDGELIEGRHPPLVYRATWEACADVRTRNQRRTSKTWTRHSYPLTPLLYCGVCGGPVHGKVSTRRRRTDLYYACNNSSAIGPPSPPTSRPA
jgi:hypothetical protein